MMPMNVGDSQATLSPGPQRRARGQRERLARAGRDDDRVGVVVEAAPATERGERLAQLADALDRAVLERARAVALDRGRGRRRSSASSGIRSSAG